jgi:hypothetical protein
MLHLSAEYCVKRAYPQCVDVITIHKIASTEDSCLEMDVHLRSSDMDKIDHRVVF